MDTHPFDGDRYVLRTARSLCMLLIVVCSRIPYCSAGELALPPARRIIDEVQQSLGDPAEQVGQCRGAGHGNR